MKKTITIEGMQCGHCQASVEKALASLDGVQSIAVDLKNKKASISLSQDISDQVIADAVKEAGFTVSSCTTE